MFWRSGPLKDDLFASAFVLGVSALLGTAAVHDFIYGAPPVSPERVAKKIHFSSGDWGWKVASRPDFYDEGSYWWGVFFVLALFPDEAFRHGIGGEKVAKLWLVAGLFLSVASVLMFVARRRTVLCSPDGVLHIISTVAGIELFDEVRIAQGKISRIEAENISFSGRKDETWRVMAYDSSRRLTLVSNLSSKEEADTAAALLREKMELKPSVAPFQIDTRWCRSELKF